MLDLENMNSGEKDLALLCQICNVEKYKYRCPKCQYKTCSLICCKQHKEEYNCDGIKPPFVPISKFSEFNDEKSIEDQKFLHNLSQSILKDNEYGQKRRNPYNQNYENFNSNGRKNKERKLDERFDGENLNDNLTEIDDNNDSEKNINYLNNQDKQLFSNCHKKRIWLQYNEDKNFEGSRYESYSDVINWSIKLEFVKEFNDDGTVKVEKCEDSSQCKTEEEFTSGSGDTEIEEHSTLEDTEQSSDISNAEETPTPSVHETPKESQLINECSSVNENKSDEGVSEIADASPLEEGECEESDNEPPEEVSSKVVPVEEETKIECIEPEKDKEIFYEDTKEVETKEKGRFTYIARNIVESIKVSTLIRQFIKPKPYGVVVSKSELNNETMSHFINAGLDNIIVYMKVPFEGKERYYVIDMNKSILDNLRNRYILNVPTFIITLNTEFSKIKTLSEIESLELHEYFKGKRNRHNNGGKQNNHQNNDRNAFGRKNFNRNQRGRFNNRRGRN
ncbi:Zinc finger, HIT-type domain-containing protein [Strongyloides ratti]|uniref:Zinc finger, HIT-type domain-containing protein n=1 Tax=Strongyloides ratti TaxID=34506 RepID=A0A090LLB7_STRRB|nr:Zinc finger, HIT-type domain-containing protein [Strongyloides ratti]CEF68968.1 Zinc finger, HIT-type domain-containing protein [Strongyloides ratti]